MVLALALVAGAQESQPAVPAEAGMYYSGNGGWKPLVPEVVNWKTAGKLKKISSVGLAKSDVEGHVAGAHSTNTLKLPVDLVVKTPDGVDIADYQLLYLHEHGGVRDFRTATGHVRARDVIPFESEKVADRTWKVSLPNLGPGEYGFIPPSAAADGNDASLGRIYSFRILE